MHCSTRLQQLIDVSEVNRGHGLREFVDAAERCKNRGLRLCTHLILGFPHESREEMLQTPQLLNRLNIDGVKLHNLHVIKNTLLEKFYHAGEVSLLNRQEYVTLVVDFLERLNPEISVHRLTGETYRAITVAPDWSVNKMGVHNAIQKEIDEVKGDTTIPEKEKKQMLEELAEALKSAQPIQHPANIELDGRYFQAFNEAGERVSPEQVVWLRDGGTQPE